MKNLPRWVPLAAALALTACNTAAPPQASDQPTVPVISGKVATWSGTGTVGVPGLNASALVNADGTFTLTLPAEASLAGRTRAASDVLSGLGCSGALQSSQPGTVGLLVAALTAGGAGGTRQVSAVEWTKTGLLSRHVQARVWLYTSGQTQLRGLVDCAGLLNVSQLGTLPVQVSVNTQRGWNVVDVNINVSANVFGQLSGSGTAVNAAAGSGATTWRTPAELQAQIAP